MFLSRSKLLFIVICITWNNNFVRCSRSRMKDEGTSDPTDGIFTSDTNSASISSAKKSRVPTRWPLMDTWITEHVQRGSSSTSTSSNKSEMSSQSSHPPLAENIKCSTRGHIESFTAVISQPFGFGNVPLFEDAVNSPNPLTSEECQMKPSGSKFLMKISDFAKCGVTSQKASDGKEWLAVSIVFPYIGRLRTSDDEHVMIMCKPQDRVATSSHVLDYRPNMPSGPKAIYHSPNHELDTKILMFTRKSSSSSFTEELSRNALIEVGQDLQFRAVVRPGDGWKYAKLKDLTIQRTSQGHNEKSRNHPKADKSGLGDTAYLVMDDGCRNPVFAAVAPKHPSVDANNPLVVNFVFKAFMFQDMADGDSLRISAKIVACQEQADCQPGICLDDHLGGHGRRKRALLPLPVSSNSNPQPKDTSNSSNCINDWTRDFELNVVMPGFAKNRIDANLDGSNVELFKDGVRILQTEDTRCRNVIFATALVSMVLVVTTATVAIVSLRSKQSLIDKYSSEDNLSTSASASVSSFSPAIGCHKGANISLASSFLKSSVRGLNTRSSNTRM